MIFALKTMFKYHSHRKRFEMNSILKQELKTEPNSEETASPVSNKSDYNRKNTVFATLKRRNKIKTSLVKFDAIFDSLG